MIEIKNIKIQFEDKVIFENYSLSFPTNQIYCIVGKSGCGKSTLIRAIAGLQQINRGEILLNGKKVTKPNKSICMMHQNHSNFPWLSALNNVLFPISLIRIPNKKDIEQAKDVLKIFHLENDSNKLPHELSGGMNQRLSMARVIMQNPDVLLMDEPLSALDEETRSNLQDFLIKFNTQNNLIIIVTHSMDEAEKLARNNIIKL